MTNISLLAFGAPGIQELLIIAAILLFLFGGTKLPSLMRNLGRSTNEFKRGMRESSDDDAPHDGDGVAVGSTPGGSAASEKAV